VDPDVRRRKAVAEEDRAHRCCRNGDAKALQFTDDPPVAPARVLACESKTSVRTTIGAAAVPDVCADTSSAA
jgi:hypothetical protein